MNTRWTECYLSHFARYFDKPFDVQTYREDDGAGLRLATFDRGPYPNYRMYASLGLADQVDRLKDRGELILLADDPGKDIPFLFLNSLFFILDKGVPLGSRFHIGGIEKLKPDFAEYFDKTAIYYTLADGFPPGFEVVQCNGDLGAVYQGIFISWAEQDYLKRHGPEAFEDRFRKQDADLCSLRRPSSV
jgi:hypothetical protein